MITQHFSIEIADTPNDASKYEEDTKMVKIDKCIVVGKGTEQGNPTVDLQLTDADGNKYLIMTTGNLVEMLSGACVGVRSRGMN